MESVASLSAVKAGKAYIVQVYQFRPDGDSLYFQIDSGACLSLIGLNTVVDDESAKSKLKNIIEYEIQMNQISSSPDMPKTITHEPLEVYPCKRSGVSIAGTQPITLYFYIYLGDIGIPLLGFDYVDDCAYHHSIGGDFIITAVANEVGKRFYQGQD